MVSEEPVLPGTASLGRWGLCSRLEARVQGPRLGPSCSQAEHLRAWFAWWAVGEVGAGTEGRDMGWILPDGGPGGAFIWAEE